PDTCSTDALGITSHYLLLFSLLPPPPPPPPLFPYTTLFRSSNCPPSSSPGAPACYLLTDSYFPDCCRGAIPWHAPAAKPHGCCWELSRCSSLRGSLKDTFRQPIFPHA